MKHLFRILLLTFSFCIYGNLAFSQRSSAFYDAVKLSDAVESNNETQFYKVVATYTGLPYRSEVDKKAIDAKLQQAGNTVLLEYTELFRQRQLSGRTITTASMGRGNAIPGAAVATGGGGSGVGPAGLAEGVSRFIVDRVKQEVLLAFFERFYQDFMQKPELQMLFPATYNYMTVFEGQGKEVGLMIDVLRNAFKKDMNNVSNTFMRVAQAEKYQNYINERPALKTTIATAAGIGYLIDNRDHPAVVIDKLTRLDFIKNSPSDELTRAINSLAFVSNALKDSLNSPNSWITQEQLQFLETVPSGPALFMGLNLQRYGHLINQLEINPKDLPIKYQTHLYWNSLNAQNNTVKMKDVLGSYRLNYYTSNYVPLNDSISNAAYNIFRPYFNDFLTLTADIDEQLGQLKNKRRNGQSFDVDEFMGYVNLFTDMVSVGLKSATFGAPSSQNTLLRITPSLLDMRRSIQKQDYTAAVIDLNVLLLSALPQSTGIKDDILRYSMFIANVASAQNSQELHWALETAALPTGSARVKRESLINISLNAYTGPFFGGENLLDTPAQNDWGSLVALAAPIGIAFSTGLSGAGSVTLLTSFIDVGALVSYRFGDSKAGALPEISFKNIVAPGLYMVYGFPKTPLSVGAGVQYGPQIRKVTINNAEANTSAYRIGVFAGIDIPVLNFYNKPR